ncbi:asparagine synthetase [Artemisia annua]|uniref:Asparagine synthetase n=1 Tax=Artemisia annua TaxID=35608 RepID=A0A2U1LU79_ARTAN|nr:asparagine synthetase [Artemisia annua]
MRCVIEGVGEMGVYVEGGGCVFNPRKNSGLSSLWPKYNFCEPYLNRDSCGLDHECKHFEVFPPGHLYSSKIGRFKRWYNPPWFSEAIPSKPYDPIVLRRALKRAVIKRLMIDVPFGVLLSGGLDSSLVESITAHHFGSPDLIAAREVADYLGTIHREFHFSVQDGIDAIEDVIYNTETCDVTTVRASTPMFLMSCKIKSLRVKMVIYGEGADEIFGRYLYFHKAPNKEEFHRETCRKDIDFCDVLSHIEKCLLKNLGHTWQFSQIDMEKNHIEKWILRRAFDDKDHPYLPKKEQFSDAVGYSWIDGLKYYAELHNPAILTVPGCASVACSTVKAVEWDVA